MTAASGGVPLALGERLAISRVPNLKGGFPLLLAWKPGDAPQNGVVNVIQMDGQNVIGGNTFVLRVRK